MKKIVCILMTFFFIICLCACSNTRQKTQLNSDQTSNNPLQKGETTAGQTKNGDTLYEDENVKINLHSINFQEGDSDGPYMYVEFNIQNKIEETINIEFYNSSLNSFATNAYDDTDIDAKQTSEFYLLFNTDDVAQNNLNSLKDIKEISFGISINNESRTIDIDEQIKIYPNNDRTYSFVGYELQKGDVVLMDNEYCTIIYKGNYIKYDKTISVDYYIMSKDDQVFSIKIDEVKIGSIEHSNITPAFIGVLPNKEFHGYWSIWSKEDIINKSDTISFKFEILGNNFETRKITETFTFNIEK